MLHIAILPQAPDAFRDTTATSVADLARRGEDAILFNLLRRHQSPLTANDVGFSRSFGKTAYEWCTRLGKDVLVQEMNFFLVNTCFFSRF
jgi:hypothetical protein